MVMTLVHEFSPCISHVFIGKQLNIYKHQMKQIWRKKREHNAFAVGIEQELNYDLHIRCHEYFSVFTFEHLVHEHQSQPKVILKDPVSSNALHIYRISLKLEIVFVLTHHAFEVAVINIRRMRWRYFYNFIVITVFKYYGLFIHHLDCSKGRRHQIGGKVLEFNQVLEDVFKYTYTRVGILRKKLQD